MTLEELIEPQEGWSAFPYKDSAGIWTIGWGHNMQEPWSDNLKSLLGWPARNLYVTGITGEEGDAILKDDVQNAIKECQTLPYWESLDNVRQAVVADMVFNMGKARFLGFHRLNLALAAGTYQAAGHEMKDSNWYDEVHPIRADKLIAMMITGEIPACDAKG